MPPSMGASPEGYPNLPDGYQDIKAGAADAAGSVVEATPAGRTWTMATAAPAAQPPTHDFVQNDQLGTSTVPVKLTWSATDDETAA